MADNILVETETPAPSNDGTGEGGAEKIEEAIEGPIGEARPGEKGLEKKVNEVGGEGWLGEEDEDDDEGESIESDEYEEGEDEEGEESKEPFDMGELMQEDEEEQEGEAIEEKAENIAEEMLEEEMEEELPPDPSAPYDFSDSKEALKAPFELRPDQLAEVETLWALYQEYTPAYTELDEYVTPVELVYLLKCLLLMTYTPEQMQELIDFCVRPPHPENHVNFEQFVKMVTIRQRDLPIEEELRSALEVMDPEKTGLIEREYLRELLGKYGHKMPSKNVDNFIKEVDMSNDGTIGVEDVVGTLCIDLNRDDIVMLQNQLNPPREQDANIDNLL